MKRQIIAYVLVGIFSIVGCNVFAQTNSNSSKKLTPTELSIEKKLNQAQNAFTAGKVDSILYYYNKAFDIANKNELPYYKAEAYHGLGRVYSALNQPDTALVILKKAANYRRDANDLIGLNKTLTNLGEVYLRLNQNIEGLQNAKEAIAVGKKANYDRGVGIAYMNGGRFLKNIGKNEEAIEYYQEASKYFAKIKFDAGIGMCYNNLAAVYYGIEQMPFAIEYYRKSMDLQMRLGNKQDYADAAMNLGSIYSGFNRRNVIRTYQNFDSMFFHYTNALEIYREIKNPVGEVKALINIGIGYFMKDQFKLAKETFDNAYKKAEQNNLMTEIIVLEKSYGIMYHKMGDFKKAKEYYNKAYPYIIKSNLREEEMNWYQDMAINSDSLKEYKEALRYFQKYMELTDTLREENIQKTIAQLSMRYGSELKDQEIAAGNERQKLMQEKNDEMQKRLLYIVIGLIFIGAMLLLVFYSFVQKRKANKLLVSRNEEIMQQKEEIEVQRNQVMSQKNIIEEQQTNILDSIHYACRIQEAILPQEETIQEFFQDNLFVLFKPRDIVSGDFYWLGKKGNKKIVVAADCTGHGVPGAFMSMLGTAFLNEIVASSDSSLKSSDILNQLREYVIVSLRQTGKSGEQKDGMDISLFMYDEETKILDFAGANNPLLIVRKKDVYQEIQESERIKVQDFISESDTQEFKVIQISGDKMPIGIYSEQKPFESISIPIQKGDAIYTFSDGYQDQFGGEKNKKFMIKRLKQLLVDMNSLSMNNQKQVLDKTILDWIKQGDTEQVDDVLVIGLHL